MMFIFGTSIAFGVYITMKVADPGYNLGVKGQGHIYIKSVLQVNVNLSYIFGWRVFIFGTTVVYGVSGHGHKFEVKGQGQIYLNSVSQLAV